MKIQGKIVQALSIMAALSLAWPVLAQEKSEKKAEGEKKGEGEKRESEGRKSVR